MNRSILSALATALLLCLEAGCGSRGVYDAMRLHQEQRCLELQGTDRNECLQRTGMSYDEYRRHLEERAPDP